MVYIIKRNGTSVPFDKDKVKELTENLIQAITLKRLQGLFQSLICCANVLYMI